MTDKKEKDAVKINISKEGAEAQEEIQPAEESVETEEKSLSEMTEDELLEKFEELEAQAQKNYDLYLRSQAEIDNIQKRNRKDKEEWIKYSNESLVKDILPALDNLENAITHSQNENSFDCLSEGVELTLKGLRDSLIKIGLKDVQAIGELFDPNFHHAVSEEPNDKKEPGTILKELQKGYMLHQRLIRPAMVILSKKKQKNEECDNE